MKPERQPEVKRHEDFEGQARKCGLYTETPWEPGKSLDFKRNSIG